MTKDVSLDKFTSLVTMFVQKGESAMKFRKCQVSFYNTNKKKIVEHYRTLTSVTGAVISWICTQRPRGGRVFYRFCSTFKESEDPIENIMRIMSLSRKDALKYMRDKEAILLTAIPTKRVSQHTDFYEGVPH